MLRITLMSLFALSSLSAAPVAQPSLEQQCQALVQKWQARFQAEGMDTLISPPFVLAGDGGVARLERYRDRSVLAAAEAMHRQFFRTRPDKPILILLFESEGPYRRLAKKWFGDDDVTRFGYFRRDNIMVMNVGTGTGTLVHELTHALIRPDFPDVPDWFNEGLGSLFEQCTIEGGQIRGLTNWRLPALQKAIRADKLRPLRELIESDHFYGDSHVGMNYAQARYLLMYLQEHEQLGMFYSQLKADHVDDPSGLKTLQATIAPDSLDPFAGKWRQWVLRLRFQ
ncbi:hypothetical protein BH20VER1_BH20VER1_32040 [soil metagenome]